MPALRTPVTDALLVTLRATTTPDLRPLRIGDHRAPESEPADTPELPFAVVYEVSTSSSGTYFDPQSDGRHLIQVTSVGTTRRSAASLADAVRNAVLGRNASTGAFNKAITPVGFVVIFRELESGGPATQEGEWWNVVDTFALSVVPA